MLVSFKYKKPRNFRKSEFCCKEMFDRVMDFSLLEYIPKFRMFLINRVNGSADVIKFCPWCASKLPQPLDRVWREEMEKIVPDFDYIDTPRRLIPSEYETSKWWRDRGL